MDMTIKALDAPTRATQIIGATGDDVRAAVADIVEAHASDLVAVFYATLIVDQEASRFLSHDLVNERLSLSLKQWLSDLYGKHTPDVEAFIERQKLIGDVHARMRIPIHLVMQAANILKVGIFRRLKDTALPRADLWAAVVYTNSLMDLAIEIMSQAFVNGTASRVETDEAYRLFSLGQDISLDKETQRAALLEWSQSVLFAICAAEREVLLSPISASDFGLWLHHRASVLFQGSAGLARIEGSMRLIDGELLPQLREARAADPARLTTLLERFQAIISEMKFLLSDMFQAAAAMENGRDPLTKTLNRRFLPSILGREIAIANESDKPFSLLMIDIDHFKQINDSWGHPAGDSVLSQVAEVILDACRLSDFVFRYGGEEFLVALVETDDAAYRAAERIRTAVERRSFLAPDNSPLPVTASIGIATFDGHPDFNRLIQSADQALYRAKKLGRNRSMSAEAPVLDKAG